MKLLLTVLSLYVIVQVTVANSIGHADHDDATTVEVEDIMKDGSDLLELGYSIFKTLLEKIPQTEEVKKFKPEFEKSLKSANELKNEKENSLEKILTALKNMFDLFDKFEEIIDTIDDKEFEEVNLELDGEQFKKDGTEFFEKYKQKLDSYKEDI